MTARSDRVTDTLVLNGLHEPIFVVSPDGTLVHANQRLGEITTRSPAELENRPLAELRAFVESGFEDLQEGINAVLRDSVPERRVELSMVHPEDTPVDTRVPAEARVTRLSDEEGVVGVLVVMRDITDRKETEQHLRASERRFRAMFEGHSAPMLLIEPQSGSIEEANAAASEFYGYDVGELTDMTIQRINRLSPAEVAAERRRAQARDRNHFEFEHELASGEVRPVEVHSSPVEVNDRELLFSIIHDISERRRREREFEQIFEGVQDAISIHDPDTLEILDVNEAYLDMVGCETVEEVQALGVSGLTATQAGYTEQRGREIHQRVVESGRSETVEWRSKTRAGERIWLEVKVTPAVIGGEQRTIAIHRDITERKRREQRLAVFNRILRHNLRNQLDVIRSYAEELTDRTADGYAEHIVNAVNELAGIGRRAREVDRLVSKDDAPTEIDIAGSLRETIETIDPPGSDVTLTTEFPEEARLRTNEESVTMAVESALENALEHAASAVTVAVEDAQDECTITVADDGPGIPEDELAPIEERAETRLQHGRGLGLWQLRWCVDDVDGELSFETDGGTTVRITVPDRRESNPPE